MDEKIERAELNLQRKLEWIGRFDTRITFTAGVSITMLGVLVTAAANVQTWNCLLYASFGLAMGLLLFSLVFVYFSQYPKTTSVNTSLLYFGTIGAMKADQFKKEFKQASNEDYLEDLLSQIHKNSEILCRKFSNLKTTMMLLLISVTPWLVAIYYSNLFFK